MLHPQPGLSLLPEGVSVGHVQVRNPAINTEKGQRANNKNHYNVLQ